ncbi:MAG: hypothetical protein KDJ19_06415 [Hyphomicrobiaceae bacterium]|nr:hypothetical protein [Hyphomicrobiaceae bacterium]MCC0023988.1 hypothetical protein [Hyphomicrobiaceae bacterium]
MSRITPKELRERSWSSRPRVIFVCLLCGLIVLALFSFDASAPGFGIAFFTGLQVCLCAAMGFALASLVATSAYVLYDKRAAPTELRVSEHPILSRFVMREAINLSGPPVQKGTNQQLDEEIGSQRATRAFRGVDALVFAALLVVIFLIVLIRLP